MNIRAVTPSDLDTLRQIAIQTFTETFAADNSEADMQSYIAEKLSTQQLARELANPESAFFFAEIEGRAAGYLKLNFGVAQTEAQQAEAVEIERIYVLQAYHGKGVGQALYQTAVDIARAHRAPYIWLGVWEHNHRALRFYEKNGFKAFDKHVFTLGSDEQTDILMKLELPKEKR